MELLKLINEDGDNMNSELLYDNGLDIKLPEISVCFSTYRVEKTVDRALDAIFRQTDKDFELVVSDDCSPDGTMNVVLAWVRNNDKKRFPVKIYRSTVNQGITRNRLRGLSYAKGKWNLFSDGDDYLERDGIERLKRIINRLQPTPSIIKVAARDFNAMTMEELPNKTVDDQFFPPGDPVDGAIPMGSSGYCVSRGLFDLFKDVKLDKAIIADDAVLGRRAMLHKGMWRVADKIYNCGIAPTSASGGGVSGKLWIEDRINRWDLLLKDIVAVKGCVPADWARAIFQYRRNMVLDARMIDCSNWIWPFLWMQMVCYSRREAIAALKKRIKLIFKGSVNAAWR